MSTPRAQILISNTTPTKKKQGSSDKWLIAGLMQSRRKMSLEPLVMTESKKVLQNRDGDITKYHGIQLVEASLVKPVAI